MTSPIISGPPLAVYDGERPQAPTWFATALENAPERRMIDVDGTMIEALSWGERGKPGLLLLHGNSAHADWWSFIAPFFAADYRVTALSWSGMGGSDHREHYRFEMLVDEIVTVSEATGIFEGGPPLLVGHSFGGYPMMMAVQRVGDRLKAAVIVDTPFSDVDEPERFRPPEGRMRAHRPSPTLAAALSRFRLMPPQECENLFLVDHIARTSLVEVAGDEPGFVWRFDPSITARLDVDDNFDLLANAKCPVALIWGDRSMLMPPDRVARMRARLPAGSPAIAIPDAAHHVMMDQPLAFVAALRGLFAGWPG